MNASRECAYKEEVLRCRDQRGMLIPGTRPYQDQHPSGIGSSRWNKPSSPFTTTMSMPSKTKRRTSRPTTKSHRSLASPSPRSSASSAVSPSSRSQDSSRPSAESGIPTPQPSRQCGSATSALPRWRRSSPRSPQDLHGSEGGGSGHLVASCDRKDRLAVPGRPMRSLVAEGPGTPYGVRDRMGPQIQRRSREPQLCDDPHAGLSLGRAGTPAIPRNKAAPNG
jgi:hypothetical protein